MYFLACKKLVILKTENLRLKNVQLWEIQTWGLLVLLSEAFLRQFWLRKKIVMQGLSFIKM